MIVLNFEAPEYLSMRILLSITHTLFAIILRHTFRSKSFWFYPNWNGFYCLLDSRRDSFLLCQPIADYMLKDMATAESATCGSALSRTARGARTTRQGGTILGQDQGGREIIMTCPRPVAIVWMCTGNMLARDMT